MSEEIDLSQFDDIADRVERAKAKSAAVRAAKGGGSVSGPAAGAGGGMWQHLLMKRRPFPRRSRLLDVQLRPVP